MKVKDLIAKKDYKYISWRIPIDLHDGKGLTDIFIGECKSVDGKLISLDGDTFYDEEDEVIRYKEFDNKLSITVKYEE